MVTVTRLTTVVELVGADTRTQVSVSARLAAELTDGRRVVLLDDRGWTSSGPPDLWATTTIDEIAGTARVVVGPDEAYGAFTQEEVAVAHWGVLAATLAAEGVEVGGPVLRRLPHDVEVGPRLRSRLDRRPG